MTKLLRSFLLLSSFALPLALFGGSVYPYLNAGERIELFTSGTTGGELYITNTDTGQLAAIVYVSPNNPGTWSSSYYYGGGVYLGGTLTNYGSSYASITGLPAGNYRIDAYGSGGMVDDYVSQSGNSFYIYQHSLYSYDSIDFAFDVW